MYLTDLSIDQLAAYITTQIYVRDPSAGGFERWYPCSVGGTVDVLVQGATGCVMTQSPRREGALVNALDAAAPVRGKELDLVAVCTCDGLIVALERGRLEDSITRDWLRDEALARTNRAEQEAAD